MEREVIGDGLVRAVLVHGNGLCGAFYRPLARALAERSVTVELVTLPGFHGVTPAASPGWDAMVDAVLQPDRGVPVTLIGHSMGAMIALLATARAPRSVDRLVLLEPAVPSTWWLARMVERAYLRRVSSPAGFRNWNGLMRRVHDEPAYPPEAITLFVEGLGKVHRPTLDALFTTMSANYPLPTVSVPSLVVWGADRGLRARAMGCGVVRHLRAAEVVVPRAAHWLVHEADAAVADAVAAFMGDDVGRSD